MRKLSLLLAMVVLAISAWGQEPSTERLSVDFLGLYLGCDAKDVEAVWEAAKDKLKPIMVDKANPDGIAHAFSGNHRLNGVSNTSYIFWNDKLRSIQLYFKTKDAAHLRDVLKSSIEKKYGKKMIGDKNELNCSLVADGMLFQIFVRDGFPDSTVFLLASHVGIADFIKAEEKRRESENLGDF